MSGAIPTREVARRVFAGEFNDATHTFRESDNDRAPIYLLLPTGARANRVMIAGTLTEKDNIGDDSEYWRGRVVDPTGTFFAYAGQYQPEAAAALREIEPPAYVTIVGKPRTYDPEDSDDILVSVQPESVSVVTAATRDRWVVETAEQTLDRIEGFAPEASSYAAMAQERHEPVLETYRNQVISALESLDTAEPAASPAVES